MAAGSASSCTYLTTISSDALSMHLSITFDEDFCTESIATCVTKGARAGERLLMLSFVLCYTRGCTLVGCRPMTTKHDVAQPGPMPRGRAARSSTQPSHK